MSHSFCPPAPGRGQDADCPAVRDSLAPASKAPCLCPASALQALAVLAVYPLPGRPWARQLWHSRPWQACPWHSRPAPDSCPRCHHWSRLRACARPAEGAPLPAGIMVCLLPASSAGPAPEGGKPGPLPALPSPALRQAGPSKAMLTSMSKRQSGQKESHVKKIDASPEPSALHVQKMDTAHTCLTPCG